MWPLVEKLCRQSDLGRNRGHCLASALDADMAEPDSDVALRAERRVERLAGILEDELDGAAGGIAAEGAGRQGADLAAGVAGGAGGRPGPPARGAGVRGFSPPAFALAPR